MKRFLTALAFIGFITSCARRNEPGKQDSMNEAAVRYVKLVLAVGQHDPDYVDAYYGPPEWKAEAEHAKTPLARIAAEAEQLIGQLPPQPAGDDELAALRHEYLRKQLGALRVRVGMLSGAVLKFDEESRGLYDAAAPVHPESYFQNVLDELEKLLPGSGALIERYDAFRKGFIIPSDKLGLVFDASIAECRNRTLPYAQLPDGESFTVEYVENKPWSAYNWYKGNYLSLIQVNTDLPIYVDRAIDLACHEGYPGHHVYNVLIEKHLVRDRGWVEMSVYPLFSPQSLIAEGTANYGIDIAFPGDERLAFERDVLFPLAGLNATRAAEYHQVRQLVSRLSYAGNEAARRYLDGEIDRAAAAGWLARYAMMSPASAEQRTRFMDRYPELRHQLQPGPGSREAVRRIARRRRRQLRKMAGVHEAALFSAAALGPPVALRTARLSSSTTRHKSGRSQISCARWMSRATEFEDKLHCKCPPAGGHRPPLQCGTT